MKRAITLLACQFFGLALGAGSVQAQGPQPESEVVFYVSANLATGQALANAFKEKHPGIDVKIYRTSGENMVNKIATEKRAGKILFDVIFGASVPFLTSMQVLQPYESPEFAAHLSKFRDPNNLWAAVSMNYYVLAYNGKLVAENEVPKDWSDLLDPRWRKNIGMDPEEFSWLAAMETYLGEAETEKLMGGLGKQEIEWRKGHSNFAQLLAAGEFKVGLGYAHGIEDLKSKGAKVDWVRTTRPIVVDVQAVGLSGKPPHPVAAKMLYDFILSVDGQKAILKDNKTPVRPGILPPDSPLNPDKLMLQPPPQAAYENLGVYAKKFDKYFGPRR
jgi:iron(III) transport system substrate-binding protein